MFMSSAKASRSASSARSKSIGEAAGSGVTATCRGSQRLRHAEEETTPRAELRRAYAHAGAVADFVDLVEHVDDVEPRRERAGVGQVKDVRNACVHLGVVRQGLAVRNIVPAVAVRLSGRQLQVGAQT